MDGYNLKAVQLQTGLSAETLRAWERRYGAVTPKRDVAGRRFYSHAEVQRLSLLSSLVKRGFRIGDIANLTESQLTRSFENVTDPANVQTTEKTDKGVSELIACLDDFDLQNLQKKMSYVRYQMSPREIALDLVPAVMARVGTLIDERRFSIAEEHALSQIVQNELRIIYDSLKPVDGTLNPHCKVLIATREGDHHELGPMLAAIICRSKGLSCDYLGPNFPASSLIQVARSLKPRAIVLGLSFLGALEERISPREFVEALDKDLSPGVEFWLGGSGTQFSKTFKTKRRLLVFDTLPKFEKKLNKHQFTAP